MPNVVAVILAGGRGTRLYPLTRNRAKPSVPIAGKFRLIDIPMSNCIHSEIREIYILTQFNSASLNTHIAHTYQFENFAKRFVHLLAAQQTFSNPDWYQGTADAVRQNLNYIVTPEKASEHVLILAGDHLYRMDYRGMIQYHQEKEADITVGVIPVAQKQASRFGILKVEKDGRITRFVEKPQATADVADLKADLSVLEDMDISSPAEKPLLASMGIYIFKKDTLMEKLSDESNVDFGEHILPKSISQNAIYAYPFEGYWEDIGTIKSFYEVNLELLDPMPPFDFYDESMPVYTYRYPLPGAKVNQSRITACILADGAIVNRSEITRSLIGIRGIVRTGTRIENTIVMGCDSYENPMKENSQEGIPPVGIGSGCFIRKAIIDKNARVGDEVMLVNENAIEHADGENYYIRDSIIVIPKNAVIPSGTII